MGDSVRVSAGGGGDRAKRARVRADGPLLLARPLEPAPVRLRGFAEGGRPGPPYPPRLPWANPAREDDGIPLSGHLGSHLRPLPGFWGGTCSQSSGNI